MAALWCIIAWNDINIEYGGRKTGCSCQCGNALCLPHCAIGTMCLGSGWLECDYNIICLVLRQKHFLHASCYICSSVLENVFLFIFAPCMDTALTII